MAGGLLLDGRRIANLKGAPRTTSAASTQGVQTLTYTIGDSAADYEFGGQEFESLRARHKIRVYLHSE